MSFLHWNTWIEEVLSTESYIVLQYNLSWVVLEGTKLMIWSLWIRQKYRQEGKTQFLPYIELVPVTDWRNISLMSKFTWCPNASIFQTNCISKKENLLNQAPGKKLSAKQQHISICYIIKCSFTSGFSFLLLLYRPLTFYQSAKYWPLIWMQAGQKLQY